uniref:Uncharacterized protein n=1 Tax=Leersia perrieri TaxID=77586 RepID=A0A0D9W4C1_9ORYZ
MAGPYAPQLTRWRVAMGGGARARDFVEHHGSVISLRPDDYFHRSAATTTGEDEEEEEFDRRERVFLGGRLYPVADETTARVIDVGGGGRPMRCVEFCPEPGSPPLRLTVVTTTAAEEGKKKKQEVAEIVDDGGAARALGARGECHGDEREGTVEHVVEVEAFVLLVSVRPELARIVRVQRLN